MNKSAASFLIRHALPEKEAAVGFGKLINGLRMVVNKTAPAALTRNVGDVADDLVQGVPQAIKSVTGVTGSNTLEQLRQAQQARLAAKAVKR